MRAPAEACLTRLPSQEDMLAGGGVALALEEGACAAAEDTAPALAGGWATLPPSQVGTLAGGGVAPAPEDGACAAAEDMAAALAGGCLTRPPSQVGSPAGGGVALAPVQGAGSPGEGTEMTRQERQRFMWDIAEMKVRLQALLETPVPKPPPPAPAPSLLSGVADSSAPASPRTALMQELRAKQGTPSHKSQSIFL